MPLYTFKSNKTGEEWDGVMSYTKLEAYYKEFDCQQVLGVTEVISQTGDIHSKTSDAFKDKMKEIHKVAGRNSNMYNGTRHD